MAQKPKKDLLARAASFDKICAEFRQKWEDSGREPSVIVGFIKANYHAVYVPWVRDELQRVLTFETNRMQDLFKRGRGEGVDQNKLKSGAMDLMIYDRVNDKVKEGMSKTQAFDAVSATMVIDEYLNPQTIKNRYYRAVKAKPEVYIFEDSGSIVLALALAKMEITPPGSDKPIRSYGRWALATISKNPTP